MSKFHPKKIDLSCFYNIWTIRDYGKRVTFERFEAERQALRHIIRNTTLAPRMRAEAQLQLTQLPAFSRPTQIRNRCTISGKARGVFRDFKMTRFNFRQMARRGELPGVKRASW